MRISSRTSSWRNALFTTLIGTAVAACGSDGGTTAPVDNFLPVFTNFWRNTKVSGHTLTLQSSNDGRAVGTFSGTETLPPSGSSQASGSWTNATFSISIARTGGAVTYGGKFISRDTIRLTRSSDTLVFARQ